MLVTQETFLRVFQSVACSSSGVHGRILLVRYDVTRSLCSQRFVLGRRTDTSVGHGGTFVEMKGRSIAKLRALGRCGVDLIVGTLQGLPTTLTVERACKSYWRVRRTRVMSYFVFDGVDRSHDVRCHIRPLYGRRLFTRPPNWPTLIHIKATSVLAVPGQRFVVEKFIVKPTTSVSVHPRFHVFVREGFFLAILYRIRFYSRFVLLSSIPPRVFDSPLWDARVSRMTRLGHRTSSSDTIGVEVILFRQEFVARTTAGIHGRSLPINDCTFTVRPDRFIPIRRAHAS